MKKRMCKYYSTTKYGWLCGRADTHNRECPPHSNWCCEIIPAKPKVVRQKFVRKINRKVGGVNTYANWGNGIVRIELSDGYTTFISEQDVDMVQKFVWHLHGNTKKGLYVKTNIHTNRKAKCVLLHRYILSVTNGEIVDHIDGNGLNNVRDNLRLCSQTQNHQNAKKRSNCSSIYKGVCWRKNEKKWHAKITVNKKVISLGYFQHEHLAAEAYNWAAMKHFGKFTRLNKLEDK